MGAITYTDGLRNVNPEFLAGLEMVSTKIYPLPGATGRRLDSEPDTRLSGLKGLTPVGDTITYYEHLATVRHRPTNIFYVAFRETMDAFLARQKDPTKYPEWLMKAPGKQKEKMIFIYLVVKHPKQLAVINSHEDWLSPIESEPVFDSLVTFLVRNNVVDAKAFTSDKGLLG